MPIHCRITLLAVLAALVSVALARPPNAFTFVACANRNVNGTMTRVFVHIDPTNGHLNGPYEPCNIVGTSYVDPLTHTFFISSYDSATAQTSLNKFSSVSFHEQGVQKYSAVTVSDLRATGNGTMLVGIVMSSPGFAFVEFKPNNEVRVLHMIPFDYFPARGAQAIDHDTNTYYSMLTLSSTESQFLCKFHLDSGRMDIVPVTGFTEYLVSYPPFQQTPRMLIGVRWPQERFVGNPEFVAFDTNTGQTTPLAAFPPQMPKASFSGVNNGVIWVLAYAKTTADAHLLTFDVPNKRVASVASFDAAAGLTQMWQDWQ